MVHVLLAKMTDNGTLDIDFDHLESIMRLKSEKSSDSSPTSCLLWNGCKIMCRGVKYGRIQTRLNKTGPIKNYYAHRVAYMCHNRFRIGQDDEVSHLCGLGLCVNGHHLSKEPHSVNCERRSCHEHKVCRGHGEYPECIFG